MKCDTVRLIFVLNPENQHCFRTYLSFCLQNQLGSLIFFLHMFCLVCTNFSKRQKDDLFPRVKRISVATTHDSVLRT